MDACILKYCLLTAVLLGGGDVLQRILEFYMNQPLMPLYVYLTLSLLMVHFFCASSLTAPTTSWLKQSQNKPSLAII